MTLDRLWAGWRSGYVSSVSEKEQGEIGDGTDATNCVFCRLLADGSPDEERNVVRTTSLSVALLNAYPYASGHLLVMPIRHVAELSELDAEESADLWRLTMQAAEAIRVAYEPDGMNLGANLGRAAGAGIPRHLHLHVLPRWVGDTNFMTAVASTRVLPETLIESWRKLHASWPA